MRKVLLLLLLITCCAPFARAQDDESKLEFFGGYSFLATQSRLTNKDVITFDGLTPEQIRALIGFDLLGVDRFVPANGFEASVIRYFTPKVGLSADFSGHFHKETIGIAGTPFRAKYAVYNILGGPHVRFTNKTRLTPFVHALVGAAHVKTDYRESLTTNPVTADDSSTRFAMALGGGFDLRVSKRVSLRIFQLDYNPILGKDRTLTASDGTVVDLRGRAQEKNFRVSFGIVFK